MPSVTIEAAPRRSSAADTGLGLMALALWSGSVTLSRSVAEQLQSFTTVLAVYGGAAIISLALLALRPGKLRAMSSLPRAYLLVCGSLFAFYIAVFYLALGLATDRWLPLLPSSVNCLSGHSRPESEINRRRHPISRSPAIPYTAGVLFGSQLS